jgi:anion-transporting  ArsA/GET3 family ATPase
MTSLDDLLTKRSLILVSGKGGVGKSVVAAALALRARALGVVPLLVECDAPVRPSPFASGLAPSHEVKEVLPGLYALNQATDDALRDYLVQALPTKKLVDLLLNNQVARAFLKAAPSAADIALLGRIMQLVDSHKKAHGGPVVVDLPATGHALNMLQAPAAIANVLRAGPVYDRAKQTEAMLADASRTVFIPVAYPEELPVTEVLELIDGLLKKEIPLGPPIMNGMVEASTTFVGDETLTAMGEQAADLKRPIRDLTAIRRWASRANRELLRFEKGLGKILGKDPQVVTLPYCFEIPAGESLATSLAEALAVPAGSVDG